jgi:hypothetical protein
MAASGRTVDSIRAEFLDGLVSIGDFSAAIGRSRKWAYASCSRGLPFISVGGTRYVILEEARAWLRRRTAESQLAHLSVCAQRLDEAMPPPAKTVRLRLR